MCRNYLLARIILICAGILLGAAAGFLWYQRAAHPRIAVASPQRRQTPANGRKQAASVIYYQTPFYYKFRLATTHIHTQEAFSEEMEFHARHNSQGFRSPEFTIAHPPNTFRMLVLGDSFTWGQGVKVDEIFPYVLQQLLNRQCDRFKTEVIALGVRGHRHVDNLIKLLAYGQTLNPDLVIIQATTNDLDFYYYLGFLTFQGKDISAYQKKQFKVFSRDSLDWKIFEEANAILKNWSEAHSVPVAFIVFPLLDTSREGHNFNHYDRKTFGWLPEFSAFDGVVHTLEKDFPTLYLMEPYSKEDHYLAVSEQDGHANATAHRIAAESLFRFVLQQKLFDCNSAKLQPEGPLWKQERVLRDEAARNWMEYNTSYSAQMNYFERLSSLYPRDPWIAHELANVYFHNRRWEDSYKKYESLLELAPGFAAPWYQMSLNIGDVDKKIELLQKNLQILPDHTPAMSELAPLYLKKNRKKLACSLLQKLMEMPQYQQQYDDSKALYSKNGCSRLITRKESSYLN